MSPEIYPRWGRLLNWFALSLGAGALVCLTSLAAHPLAAPLSPLVDIQQVAPEIQVELRFATDQHFLRKKLGGIRGVQPWI